MVGELLSSLYGAVPDVEQEYISAVASASSTQGESQQTPKGDALHLAKRKLFLPRAAADWKCEAKPKVMVYHVIVTVLLAHLAAHGVTGQGNGPTSAICSLPPVKGPCRASISSFYYNPQTGMCETFRYGGCRGNANRFQTEEQCLQTCQGSSTSPNTGVGAQDPACLQPKKIGPCRAAFRRWYYNSLSGACEMFLYGGCDHNNNNFNTQSACERRCVRGTSGVAVRVVIPSTTPRAKPSSSRPGFCSLPQETGFCRGFFPRYHFNARTEQCEQFIYGGCGGNRNRFNNEAACRAVCAPSQSGQGGDVCSLPKAVGPCYASIPRFFFDQAIGRCQRFIFGGCSGNANNFLTLSECRRACPGLRG